MLAISSFVAGYIVFFFLISEIMTLIGKCNCWALGAAPLVGGLGAYYMVRSLEKAMFFLMGSLVGFSFGHSVYVLVLAHLESHMEWEHAHNLMYYGNLTGWMIVCGMLAAKLKDKIYAIATAIIGGPTISLGFWSLLAEIFPTMQKDGWNAWSHPCTFSHNNPCTPDDGSDGDGMDGEARDPLTAPVMVPMLLAWVLVIAGFTVQFKLQRRDERKTPVPPGGGGMEEPLMYGGARPPSINNSYGGSE